ncbi:hypothetical protein IM40_09615 (plasmid) [Candidatus Paracaedimonas acanthamoebae]|nr:hypothetical protein IM40_09615 [Candidatus Paracaedimonas acanthamoebae]
MEKLVIMSEKELHRLEIIKKVSEKRLSQVQAAEILHISTRQIERLLASYWVNGPQGASLVNPEITKFLNKILKQLFAKNILSLVHLFSMKISVK